MINAPRLAPGHPDRGIDLEMAMEKEVFALMGRLKKVPSEELEYLGKRAEEAGWQHIEVSRAIKTISETYIEPPKWDRAVG